MADHAGTVFIPALGASQRFVDEGHDGPKGLLWLERGRRRARMLELVVENVPKSWRVIVVSRKDRMLSTIAALTNEYHAGLPGPTRGQSDTLLQVLTKSVEPITGPVAVMNCDVAFSHDILSEVLSIDDDVVLTHRHGIGQPIFSYVGGIEAEADHFRATKFAEKLRISDEAMTGLWRFQDAAELTAVLDWQMKCGEPHTNGEYYLSGALHQYEGGLRIVNTAGRPWLDLGTPEAVAREGFEIVNG
jgi:hypothetical protein